MSDLSKVYLSPSTSFCQLLISSMHFGLLIQVLLIFKAQPLALRWNHQLYDIVAYIYECTSKADEFIRTVGLILCKPVYHLFRITLIIEQILEAEATI